MKNKRQLAKEETRNNILQQTKKLVETKGIYQLTTKEIADKCQIAHGTLFAHFPDKENLMITVLKTELMSIAKAINELNKGQVNFEGLLDGYLLLVSKHEDLLVVIAKEFPFLSNNLKREIITTESIVRKIFYEQLEQDIQKKILPPVPITKALVFLTGTINYYLSRRELFTSNSDLIKLKKEDIQHTFIHFLKPDHEK
jgi:AcrR family transcriptional regulator